MGDSWYGTLSPEERERRAGFAEFVTEPSRPEDGPPEWPLGSDFRIVGIRCPRCRHESRDPVHRNAGSFGRAVTCSACGWSGKVPM